MENILKQIYFRYSEWTNEAIEDFESLTNAFQWKPLLAKVIKSRVKEDIDDSSRCTWFVSLIDATSENVVCFKSYVKKILTRLKRLLV